MSRRGRAILAVAGCALLAGCVPPPQADYNQLPPGNQQAQAAKPKPPENPALRAQIGEQTRQKFTIAADLLFSRGGFQITPNGQLVLNDIASRLQMLKNGSVAVYGYTDDGEIGPGPREQGISSNVDLSARRAEAVANYLRRRGINPNNLAAKGLGDADPVASNKNPAGRAQNRRIEILVEGTTS